MSNTLYDFRKMLGNTPWYKKIYYWFYRVFNSAVYFLRLRLPCFFRRGKNGYSYIDVWSFDSYLCDVIIGGVKLLKENLHGAPHELFDDNAENQTWKWEAVLDKIIEGFEAGRALIDMDYIHLGDTKETWMPKQEKLTAKFNEGMDLFKQYFFNLWD